VERVCMSGARLWWREGEYRVGATECCHWIDLHRQLEGHQLLVSDICSAWRHTHSLLLWLHLTWNWTVFIVSHRFLRLLSNFTFLMLISILSVSCTCHHEPHTSTFATRTCIRNWNGPHLPLLRSNRASLPFGQYSFHISSRVGGWVCLVKIL